MRAMSADELGIYTARHGDVVLRSAFQIVFRAEGKALRAAAAEGLLRPFREGVMLEPRVWLEGLDADEREEVDCLGGALHLANHGHLGIDHLDHVLVVRRGKSMSFAEILAPLIHDFGVDGARLIGAVRDPSGFDFAILDAFASRFRALGGRVSIGSGGQPDLRTIRSIAPDIVSIEGRWFRQVCANETAARLLRTFVRSMRSQGAQVLIEGIETQQQLIAARYVGADFLSGFLLSRPQLVGTEFPDQVIPVGDGAEVIPLFGLSSGKHQSG